MPRVRGTHRNEKWGRPPRKARGRDRDIVVPRIELQGFFRGGGYRGMTSPLPASVFVPRPSSCE